MKKILKRYILTVYEDGQSELTPYDMPNDLAVGNDDVTEDHIELSKISSRIAQVLTTIYYTLDLQKGMNPINIGDNVSKAVKRTAKQFQVSDTSVIDKCTRQMKLEEGGNLTMFTFKMYVTEYIRDRSTNLEELLLHNQSGSTTKEDAKAIEFFFKNPENIKLYMNYVEL